jgi:hypothetical protein
LFIFEDSAHERRARRTLRSIPPLAGAPLRIRRVPGLRDGRGPVHAGAFLRERRIDFDCTAAEFPRVFVHEIFHFIWRRLGNPARRAYEDLVATEIRGRARGELGWSAEWRKRALAAHDLSLRTRRWREYCCESFCDTAAWLYGGVASHPEFTLAADSRRRRRQWFAQSLDGRELSI